MWLTWKPVLLRIYAGAFRVGKQIKMGYLLAWLINRLIDFTVCSPCLSSVRSFTCHTSTLPLCPWVPRADPLLRSLPLHFWSVPWSLPLAFLHNYLCFPLLQAQLVRLLNHFLLQWAPCLGFVVHPFSLSLINPPSCCFIRSSFLLSLINPPSDQLSFPVRSMSILFPLITYMLYNHLSPYYHKTCVEKVRKVKWPRNRRIY